MNAEELKMECSPVVLRAEVVRLQGVLKDRRREIEVAFDRRMELEQVADELAEAGAKRIDVMLDLLVAYRTGRHPSERTLNNIPMAEKRWKAALARHAQLKGE